MDVVAVDRTAGVSDAILIQIAEFVAGLSDEKGAVKEGLVERVRRLFSMSGTNKQIRRITVDAARQALAFVMRLAPPEIFSTKMLLTSMRANPDVANSVLLQNETESAQVRHACTQSEGVSLSRLVELSRVAEGARAAGTRGQKLLEFVVRVIESARPALRASLSRATIGAARMYPQLDGLLDTVIERLKVRPYERIEAGMLRVHVEAFLRGNAETTEQLDRFGPLCLWDVSEVRDFQYACTYSHPFNSDLFWDTKSAERMNDMFFLNSDFKGYIGMWNVRRVSSMSAMFEGTAIEDSGIANWNTASLTAATQMFFEATQLSAGLDLSGWKFGPRPTLRSMFAHSGIVDCGIGNWDVSGADTHEMLSGATAFAGNLAKWPPGRVADAKVHLPRFGSARAFGGADTQTKIARVFADAPRRSEKGAQGQEQCAIL